MEAIGWSSTCFRDMVTRSFFPINKVIFGCIQWLVMISPAVLCCAALCCAMVDCLAFQNKLGQLPTNEAESPSLEVNLNASGH